MERIRGYFPNFISNADYAKSWLKVAYRLTEAYTDNMAMYLWESNGGKYPEDHMNVRVPASIYAKR